jgi:hypothetical protein
VTKIKNILIPFWLIIAIVGLFFSYQKAQAGTPTFTLTYVGQPGPLFNQTNLAPTNTVTKQIQVTNNNSQTEQFALNLHNLLSTPKTKLAEALSVEVAYKDKIFVSSTHLSDLPDKDIIIQDIPASQTYNYDIKVTMDTVGNEYQGQQVNFDLTFGFRKTGPKGILGESIGPVIPGISGALPQTGTNAVLSIFSLITLLGIIAVLNLSVWKFKKR